jgi:hypothetical protein
MVLNTPGDADRLNRWRGCCIALGSRRAVDVALHRLVKRGAIRRIARGAVAVLAEGTVEHRSGVTHLVVRRMTDLGGELAALAGGAMPQQSRDVR